MTLKSDAKFKEKLTCSLEYDMRSFVNFHPTTQKSQNFLLMGYFCLKYIWGLSWKIQRSYLSWHRTVVQNLNKRWPCGFKNGKGNWVNFHYSIQKSEKLQIDGLFLSKAYVSVRKFKRNYVSWHWRAIQNLKESWFVASKKTFGIWLIFMRTVERLKICTLIGSFCPNHLKI